MAASTMTRPFIAPPTLGLLPRRGTLVRGMLVSTVLHAIAIAAMLVLPRLFPSPVVVHHDLRRAAAPAEFEPVVAPQLPQLDDLGSGSMERAEETPADSGRQSDPPPLKPDYIGPQEIVSFRPNPVNRVQTILRPDLVRPPEMKFPVRLQNMVNLPVAAPPVLLAPPPPDPAPVSAIPQEVPVVEATVPNPALQLIPKQVSPVPSDTTTLQTVPSIPVPAEPQANAAKAVVVVSGVTVPPDPAVLVPDAELAGRFVVGPSSSGDETENSASAGVGRAPGPSSNNAAPPASALKMGNGSGATGGTRKERGAGAEVSAVGRSGSTPGAGGRPAAGPGVGSGSGSGAPGGGTGNGASTGISITGGVPGRNNATIAKAIPLQRSYGMMIISGGNNGGASRDLGVFQRNETVYSVTISMADAGGGPDWTMQYALLHPAQEGAALLTPPFARKKVPATAENLQLAGNSEPVFITGTIDDTGKLGSLRAVRAQDARSQPAIHALQQWEFLPAQLDGKPVQSKVLIGVVVTVAN